MLIKCAICAEMLPSQMAHQMHKEMLHTIGVLKPHQGKFLTLREKEELVNRKEYKLGKIHFYGGNECIRINGRTQ